MIVLAFDTTGESCAAALWRDGAILARRAERLGRGHAERLFPIIEQCLEEARLDWPALDRIGVVAGPGSFTGVRVGVAAARGLALALERPALGVDGFETIAAQLAGRDVGHGAARLAAVFGRAPRLLWRMFDASAGAPLPLGPRRQGDAAALLAEAPTLLAGPAAAALADLGVAAEACDPDPAAAAALAASAAPNADGPKPLYIRPPDAEPSRAAPPPRL